MIKRSRPPAAPTVLTTKGKDATEALKGQWDAGQTEFKSEAFDSSIYGHASVKKALSEGNCEKCYYCEIPYSAVAFGTVDHFRPKAIVNNTGKKADREPGYYWLAYEWTNLLMACPRCNTRIKRNKFPLAPGSPRALSHHHKIEDELPLLIDPTATDPALHIEWRDHIPRALDASPQGQATIEVLRLDSRKANRALVEARLQYLEFLWNSFCLLQHEPEHAGASKAIKKAEEDNGAFSAMTKEALSYWRSGGVPAFAAQAPPTAAN